MYAQTKLTAYSCCFAPASQFLFLQLTGKGSFSAWQQYPRGCPHINIVSVSLAVLANMYRQNFHHHLFSPSCQQDQSFCSFRCGGHIHCEPAPTHDFTSFCRLKLLVKRYISTLWMYFQEESEVSCYSYIQLGYCTVPHLKLYSALLWWCEMN